MILLAVGRYQSKRKVAEATNTSIDTVNKYISNLEYALGTRLGGEQYQRVPFDQTGNESCRASQGRTGDFGPNLQSALQFQPVQGRCLRLCAAAGQFVPVSV